MYLSCDNILLFIVQCAVTVYANIKYRLIIKFGRATCGNVDTYNVLSTTNEQMFSVVFRNVASLLENYWDIYYE